MRNRFSKFRNVVSSTAAKAAAGATALVASGAAFASGGSGSPGSAIAGELSGGKADVLLVVGACAIILGALIVWGYVKKAR
ncbi:hypothetical protein [Xanthomonas translucens]|uniref:hypothetical protein n=1 Tax=Xanthomonas campestris pv. translucens TaxID=343 RepID=UPI001F600DE2|nr:hypothetical protein [Xanthomonas translucens]UNU12607.1 hypothetical protein KBV71_07885 [Xanthomonas translucens pv. translucens]